MLASEMLRGNTVVSPDLQYSQNGIKFRWRLLGSGIDMAFVTNEDLPIPEELISKQFLSLQ